jgi:hypothetical protein
MPMEKPLVLIGFVLVAFGAVRAQETSKTSVEAQTKSANPVSLDRLAPIRWQAGSPGSYSLYSNGAVVKILSTEGYDLVASPAVIEHGPSRAGFVLIAVDKARDMTVDFDPSLFFLYSPKQKKAFPSLPPEKIEASIRRSAMWKVLLLSMSALSQQQARTTSTTAGTFDGTLGSASVTGSYEGTTVSTTTRPDEAAQERSLQQRAAVKAAAGNKMEATEAVALRHNTQFPGQKLQGFVWFKWDKHAGDVQLFVPLRDPSLTKGNMLIIPFDSGDMPK